MNDADSHCSRTNTIRERASSRPKLYWGLRRSQAQEGGELHGKLGGKQNSHRGRRFFVRCQPLRDTATALIC